MPNRTYFCSGVLAIALLLVATHVVGQEVVVRNDSLDDFSEGLIQVGFVAGESAAAWLTSPCTGDITKVQVLWRSLTGGAIDSLEDSITVFEPGTFPDPGAPRVELSGPLMVDGPLNEFLLPAPLPVSNGDEFVVSFKFLNTPPGLGPSVVTDTDGCQTPKNSLFAIPPSIWFDSCVLGVSGDFVIRGVVDCSAPVVDLDIFPNDGTGVRRARWDLAVVADVPMGVTVTGVTAMLNGDDISAFFSSCVEGVFLGDGLTLRCDRFNRELLGFGLFTLDLTLDFSDGSSGSKSVTWDILRNMEP